MSLQYKAYLVKGKHDSVKEIRRFTVDTDVSSNYDYLKNKVASVFPDVGDVFTLQYRDVDGDMISFSSDEELMQALSQVNDGLFRLFVKIKNENKKDDSGEDFCKQWKQFGFGGHYPHEHPHPHPHHGPRPHHRHDPRVPPHDPRGPPPFGFGGAFGGGFVPPQSWGFGGPWSFPEHQSQTQHQEQSQTPGEGQGTQATSSSSADDTSQQQQQSQTKGPQQMAQEYLETVGANVAEFLRPLGIDVDIDVEHNGKRTKVAESEIKKEQKKEEEKEATAPPKDETPPKTVDDPPTESPPAEAEWTVVPNQEEEEMPAASPEVMHVDFPPDMDPRLAGALRQMFAMGFSDEGGWLSRLLEAHDFNIPSALDAMQPQGGTRA